MPQGPDGNTIIIVKKVVGHGGHHGGSWKVALADFMTSMMCLFLVLWLVNTASVVTRENIASYFKQPGIFDKGSGTPLEIGENGLLREAYAPVTEGNSTVLPDKNIYRLDAGGELKTEGFTGGADNLAGRLVQMTPQELQELQKEEFERVAKEVKKAVQLSSSTSLGNVGIKIDDVGFHLEIMDTPTDSMFSSGSAHVLEAAEEELKKIALIIKTVPNPIDLAGHTDGKPYRNGLQNGYDNWDLSTDRANAARRVFLAVDIPSEQIRSVVGYADKKPKVPEDPLHPSNRRISVSLRYSEDAAQLIKQRLIEKMQPLKDKQIPAVAPAVASSSSSVSSEQVSSASSVSVGAVVGPVSSSTSSASVSSEGTVVGEKFSEYSSTSSASSETSSAAEVVKTNPEVKEAKVVKKPVTRARPINDESTNTSSAGNYAPIAGKANDDTAPLWQQKSLIFGDQNPFNMGK